jgi:O-acetyl-ADP-ribose deacetylase (regulator of RNase III)/uncharacterized protein YwgA
MIEYKTGNLFESHAEALVNTVNTSGVMGKGIALQFKNMFPHNYKVYARECKEKTFGIGDLLVVEDQSLLAGRKLIINFPTKTDWRKPSEYSYIERGLVRLVYVIQSHAIRSIAIPPLGAGNGGLDWNKVKVLLEKYLSDIDCDIQIYTPNAAIQESMKKERVKLTPARAMLLSVLFDLVKSGEFVSEFSAEKTAYFLQRFGGADIFKLDFQPNFYGPYSGKVKHVLYFLNGSYITGYSAKDRKPFEELGLMLDSEKEINDYLDKLENSKYKEIVTKTKKFLTGFYSDFGLELLSTIDYIITQKGLRTLEEITQALAEWSDRKMTMFSNPKFVSIAMKNIENHLLLNT